MPSITIELIPGSQQSGELFESGNGESEGTGYYIAGRLHKLVFRIANTTDSDLDNQNDVSVNAYQKNKDGGIDNIRYEFIGKSISTALRNIEGFRWQSVDGMPLIEHNGFIWLPMPSNKEYLLELVANE